MDRVRLGESTVNRIGISLAELKVTGMWGEPASRDAAVNAISRAVELGAGVLEVPVPFGPAADLLREARVPGAFIAARLTGGRPDLDTVRRRLGGRLPDLVLAEERLLAGMRDWGVSLGAIVGARSPRPRFEPLAAVRGPYPAPDGLVEWCEEHGLPYLASSTGILAAGELTIALPAPRGITDVERLFAAEPPATPPTAGPE